MGGRVTTTASAGKHALLKELGLPVEWKRPLLGIVSRFADQKGFDLVAEAADRLAAEDLALVKLAAQFPRIVETAAAAREPHRIAFYLYDLAAAFHAAWNVGNDCPDRRFLIAEDAAVAFQAVKATQDREREWYA